MIWYKLKEFVWTVLFCQGSSFQTIGTRRQSITQSNRQTAPPSVRQIVSQPVSESVAGRIWKARSDVSTKGTDYKEWLSMEIYECPNFSSEGCPKCVQFHNCFRLIKPYIQSVRTIFFVPGKDPYIFSEFDPWIWTLVMLTMDIYFLPSQQILKESQTR